jgi:tetratricopeptide (TPR) repeat protein
MKRASLCLCIAIFLSSSPRCLFAADALEGASNVLSQVKGGDHAVTAVDSKDAVIRQISVDLAQFRKERDSLTPDRVASAWLALFDRLWKVNANDLSQMGRPEDNESSDGPLSFERLFAEIPGPAAWPEIQKLVNGRDITKGADGARDYALQLYVAYLNGDNKTFDDLLGRSGELLPGVEHYTRESVERGVKEIKSAAETARSVNSPEDLLKHYRKMLEEFAKDTTPGSPQGNKQIQIPDLVSLAGAAEAEKLLLQTIQLPVTLEVPSGGQTKELIKKLITANAAQLKQPQWQLVDSPEGAALYEAMLAKFPNAEKKEDKTATALFSSDRGMGDYENSNSVESKRNATLCYLMGLVASGRSAEALTNAMAMKSSDVGEDFVDVMQKIDKPLVTDALYDFASKMMVRKDAPRVFQSMYCSLALSLGHTNELFSSLETRMADPSNDDAVRRGARWLLLESYLAVDETDKAVAMLRDAVKTANTNKEEFADNQQAPESVKAATLLVQLGDAIGRPELIDEGLKVLLDSAEKSTDERFFEPSIINFGRHYFSESLDDVLIRNGNTAELERLIKASMSAQLRIFEKNKQRGEFYGMNLDDNLSRLVNLYGKLGRHQDVLYLARNAEWWSTGDLAALMQSYCGGGSVPLAVHIAAALETEGATSNATTILKAYLYNNQGNDKAYSALLGIEGMALIPWLDSLYARDRFEERPLIWKAELLRKAGKLDDAEKFARQAIKVDPTDGEEPPGDRVRAYAVLADVLADEGKKEDAEFFRNVVKSVRTAENGDRLTAVGLMKRSIKAYEEAESAFANAYCVQWRLAERLYSMGKVDEAEKHYKIAFERMPEQFGQVANFCFGCEGVFNKEHSRCVAERVLSNLVQTHPDRPQVHFMMGELREAQGRETEAYESFTKAVEIDPGYLDAWEKMSCLSTLLLLPQSQRDSIALKGIEMDPLGRHFSANMTDVKDLKALWNILEKNMQYQVEPPKSLFVLEASKKAIDEEKKQGRRGYEQRWSQSDRLKPGQVIASQNLASRIVQLLNNAWCARMNMNRNVIMDSGL